jgi:hypothetical protein
VASFVPVLLFFSSFSVNRLVGEQERKNKIINTSEKSIALEVLKDLRR